MAQNPCSYHPASLAAASLLLTLPRGLNPRLLAPQRQLAAPLSRRSPALLWPGGDPQHIQLRRQHKSSERLTPWVLWDRLRKPGARSRLAHSHLRLARVRARRTWTRLVWGHRNTCRSRCSFRRSRGTQGLARAKLRASWQTSERRQGEEHQSQLIHNVETRAFRCLSRISIELYAQMNGLLVRMTRIKMRDIHV